MANTFTCLHYHIVFSTKHREPWINPDIETQIWSVLAGAAKRHRITPLAIGGFDDHIHALVGIPPSLSMSNAVQFLKGTSSRQLHLAIPSLQGHGWQDGYGAFAVSKSLIPKVENYVLGQREHHASTLFQDEFRGLLIAHGIEFDEATLWD
jgi:putative transposase